jgi:uncharacterized protein
MVRPRRIRKIFFEPGVSYFKPAGVALSGLDEEVLTREELEAVRLVDLEGCEQGVVGKKMGVSQPTLSRLLKIARKKISGALVNGKAIRVKGGDFKMVQGRASGRGLRRGVGVGGRGRMGGVAAGPGGVCVCSKCGHESTQVRGKPCTSRKCPKCGGAMTRK